MNDEDIKKVEELLKHKNDYDVYCNSNVYRPYAMSLEDWELIENLLEAYKEQKQMLINRVKYTVGLEQDLFENASNYVVPVAKIKEKIELLEKLKQKNAKRNFDTVYKDGYFSGGIDCLSELLEGK